MSENLNGQTYPPKYCIYRTPDGLRELEFFLHHAVHHGCQTYSTARKLNTGSNPRLELKIVSQTN